MRAPALLTRAFVFALSLVVGVSSGCAGLVGQQQDADMPQEIVVKTEVPVLLRVSHEPGTSHAPVDLPTSFRVGRSCATRCEFSLVPGAYNFSISGRDVVPGEQRVEVGEPLALTVVPGRFEDLDSAEDLELIGALTAVAGFAGVVVSGIQLATVDESDGDTALGLFIGSTAVAVIGTALATWGVLASADAESSLDVAPNEDAGSWGWKPQSAE